MSNITCQQGLSASRPWVLAITEESQLQNTTSIPLHYYPCLRKFIILCIKGGLKRLLLGIPAISVGGILLPGWFLLPKALCELFGPATPSHSLKFLIMLSWASIICLCLQIVFVCWSAKVQLDQRLTKWTDIFGGLSSYSSVEVPAYDMKVYKRAKVQFQSFLTSATDGKWSASRPGRLHSPGRAPVPVEELVGRAPQPASPATQKTRTASFHVLSNSLFSHIERLTATLLYHSNSAKALSAAGSIRIIATYNPYPTAFPYGNGMVLHFYQQQESSTTKTVHKVINAPPTMLPAEGRHHRGGCITPQAVTHSLVLLKMGKIISRNMLSWLELLISRYCCI